MKLYVGLTDKEWFDFLAERRPDEVNFWKPSAATGFSAVPPWSPFLFKLKYPYRAIAGGGFFVSYASLPLGLAWDSFGEKNGVASRPALVNKINGYRSAKELNPTIGCIILANPFFFPEEEWIKEPEGWKANIVQGKTYDTAEPEGALLWHEVQARLNSRALPLEAAASTGLAAQEGQRYGEAYLVKPRLGQGAFRVLVLDAYNRRCAITGEKTLPVLQAAHIRPYTDEGPHQINNGLSLRADLHLLFDSGYLTVNRDLRVEVSRHLKEDYENGREYYAMQGKSLLILPSKADQRPSREFIDWHNERIYRG